MRNKSFRLVRWLVALYLAAVVILPLCMLMSNIRTGDIRELTASAQFWPMIGNSVLTAGSATVIAVVLAFVLAYCLERSRVRPKEVWAVLFTIPMLIPSISHGMGLVMLLGENGMLKKLMPAGFELYGYPGIIMGSVLYAFPVAFLMFRDALQYEDFAIYEAAATLGIGKARRFLVITLPAMKGSLISAVFAVFTMIFTDYGVPLMTGGKVMTLPVYMYREVIGMMNFSKGAFIGILLLIPAVIAFVLDFKRNTRGPAAGSGRKYEIGKSAVRDLCGYAVCAVTVLVILLPVAAFAVLSFVKKYPVDMSFSLENIRKTMDTGAGMYMVNSLAVAMATALAGTCLAYFTAYVTARTGKGKINRMMHLISMLSLAIPGIVLGLSYVFTFKGMPFYSTIFMLVIVNMVHFLSSPYLLAYNSLLQMNENLEDVAETTGIGRFRMLAAVYVPGTQGTILEMYSFIFVNCMITISAVSFLATFRTMPAALLIPQLESQSFLEGTAFVSLLILAVNLVEKAVIYMTKRGLNR